MFVMSEKSDHCEMETITENAISAPPDMMRSRFELSSLLHTRGGIALTVFAVTLMISVAVEPPFLLVRDAEDPFRVPRVCYARAAAVSIILTGVFLKVPGVCRD
jgi:hypothetical protein